MVSNSEGVDFDVEETTYELSIRKIIVHSFPENLLQDEIISWTLEAKNFFKGTNPDKMWLYKLKDQGLQSIKVNETRYG